MSMKLMLAAESSKTQMTEEVELPNPKCVGQDGMEKLT